jgi:hypothetical protein
MNVCIMLSLTFIFGWCTCLKYLNLNCGLIWFESLEKIKRKAFRNSEEKGKAILAQSSPAWPSPAAHAPALTDRRTPSVGAALTPVRSNSLSPSARWGRSVGAGFLRPCCRCFGSDRTPVVAPQGVFRSRTVSPTVPKWFVPDARGTIDHVYRFGPLGDA